MTASFESAELFPLAALVAVVGIFLMVYVLINCVCGSKSDDKEADLITVTAHNPDAVVTQALSSPQKDPQPGTSSNEIDLNITNHNHSIQNGHISKGENHATDTKTERNGNTSSGSSPRSTGVRGLPEPPKSQSSKEKGRIGQLPEIPVDSKTSPHRSLESSRGNNSGGSSVVKTLSSDLASVKVEKHDQKPKVSDADTDYDHIEDNVTEKMLKRQSNYDHVVLVGDIPKVIPAKTSRNIDDQRLENIYAGVDDDVEVVKASPKPQEHRGGSIGAKTDKYKQLIETDLYDKVENDTYCKVNDLDHYNKETDPYNKVIEVDVCKKVEENKDSNEVKPVMVDMEDDYAHLVEEPFSDDRNVSNQSDPYARVKDDFPYARVKDDPLIKDIDDDPYNKLQDSNEEGDVGMVVSDADYAKGKKGCDEYQTVKKNIIVPTFGIVNPGSHLQSSGTELNSEYAVVSKVRKPSDTTTQDRNSGASPRSSVETASSPLAPPEPPRDYDDGAREDNSVDLGGDNPITSMDFNYIDVTTGHVVEGTQAEEKKEPPYTKVTARESLASMNARIAQNTYEVLPDADNLYATVEGGSGDGVVRRSVVEQNFTLNASTDHYTEIKAGAPAPPSLDSLHMMARVHQGEITKRRSDRKTGDSSSYYNVSPSSPVSPPKTHSRTPSGGDFRVASVTPNEGASMAASFDPDYQSVVVSSSLEESEFDPNYESVDEAKAKTRYESIDESKNKKSSDMRKARGHVYEEVTVPDETAFAKQHALNKHTYEDIKEVHGKRRDEGSVQNSGDVQRGFLGHIRKLSGDHSKVVKRKSNDFKEKDKKRESKRKVSESKESKKSDAKRKSGELDGK
ncbi:hypothetical protein CHS0354_025707 [Potamilus streckersoni]|uniref:Uncharacterized protein n=1 Tax=Potamilus streckersoni TaxID=2493646 RepID=A0AAE0S0X6_9BIVA|nr:hypothetical protein CHS0354_025707 [Potamilus streckersoni]